MQAILMAMALVATPDFPAAIAQDLGLSTQPRCSICHATESGGAGTVVQPFGVYLRSRGLQPFDEASLHNALLAADGERHSSNQAGIPDIDALKAGEDPNAPQGGGGTSLTPMYGCATSGSPTLVAALAIWVCFFVSRRQREIGDGSHWLP
jgi:hypothetical protein